MAATLKDISERTGINMGTISHVLNDRPKAKVLRPETRERILEVARELGYKRNELAATIRTGVNKTVAVIVDFRDGNVSTFVNPVLCGALVAATNHDYGVKLYSADKLGDCLDEIGSQRVKHVVAITVDPKRRERLANYCEENKVKLCFVFEHACGRFPAVASDGRAAARKAVSYFVERGHRRVALICAKHTYHYMEDRHNGYLDGLADAGLTLDQRLVDCSLTSDESEEAITRMLRMPVASRPTAFYCIADSLAFMVQRVAFKNDLIVPEDVSVIGYANSDNVAQAFAPLTTFAQPFEKMGELATRLALGKKTTLKPSPDNRYLLPTKLIERASVGTVA